MSSALNLLNLTLIGVLLAAGVVVVADGTVASEQSVLITQ